MENSGREYRIAAVFLRRVETFLSESISGVDISMNSSAMLFRARDRACGG